MEKLYILTAFLCCILLQLKADEPALQRTDANIVGHVIDKNSGEHLPFITIKLQGTNMGTTTDNTGHYYLKNLPAGKFILEVSAVGYKTVTRKVTLAKGKTLEEDFEIEEDMISLDGIVVSANRSETKRRLAPTLVQVVDLKLFETTNSVSLADGLSFQPGVRVENNCQNCGFQQVRINGLDGPYTQILVDSRPIFSALSGVYGIEQVPANMIERVEVMRGGGSALFGSSAIAGTINIITKEPIRNTGMLGHNITSYGNSAFENNTTLNASLVTDNHKAGLYIFGQNRERSGYDHNADGFTEIPEINSQTVGFRSYLKTSLYSRLTMEYHHINEYRRGGDQLKRPPHEAFIAEQVRHSINGGGLKFDVYTPNEKQRWNIYTSMQNIDRESYYGTDQNPDAYGNTKDLTYMAGSQYVYSFDKLLFMPSDLTAGIEYNYNKLEDEMLGYNRSIDQKTRIESVFLQNEWKDDKWSVLLGGRLDKHNLIDNAIFSPRVNLRFNPVEDINLRVSYSTGFRAPQAFDEDLHVAAVGGEVFIIQQAKDLKEEKSHSFSASADLYRNCGNWQTNFLVEGFYTKLDDVFVLENIGWSDEHSAVVEERRNGSGAKVMGLTLEGKVAYRNKWQGQAGFTFQRSRYEEAEVWSEDPEVPAEKKMFRSPDRYGYFTSTYNPVKPLSIALSGTYTGSMLVQHFAGYIEQDEAIKTSDFFDMNIKLSYDIDIYKGTKLQFYTGVQNLFDSYQKDFDKGKERDSAYMYGPSDPRSWFAGVKLEF